MSQRVLAVFQRVLAVFQRVFRAARRGARCCRVALCCIRTRGAAHRAAFLAFVSVVACASINTPSLTAACASAATPSLLLWYGDEKCHRTTSKTEETDGVEQHH